MIHSPQTPSLLLATCVMGAATGTTTAPASPPSSSEAVIELFGSTAGPYGESWSVLLVPDPGGDGATLAVEVFSFAPSGNLLGRFDLEATEYDLVLQEIQESRFCELPERISRTEIALHQTDLSISGACGATRHRVNLYEPDLIVGHEAIRFMRVCNTVFDLLPVNGDWPAPPAAQRLESFFDLVPCAAVVTEYPFDLRLWAHLLEGLDLDAPPNEKGGWPTTRILVTPGWDSESEWVVSIYQPEAGEAIAETVEASTGITAEAYELELPQVSQPCTTPRTVGFCLPHRTEVTSASRRCGKPHPTVNPPAPSPGRPRPRPGPGRRPR